MRAIRVRCKSTVSNHERLITGPGIFSHGGTDAPAAQEPGAKKQGLTAVGSALYAGITFR